MCFEGQFVLTVGILLTSSFNNYLVSGAKLFPPSAALIAELQQYSAGVYHHVISLDWSASALPSIIHVTTGL